MNTRTSGTDQQEQELHEIITKYRSGDKKSVKALLAEIDSINSRDRSLVENVVKACLTNLLIVNINDLVDIIERIKSSENARVNILAMLVKRNNKLLTTYPDMDSLQQLLDMVSTNLSKYDIAQTYIEANQPITLDKIECLLALIPEEFKNQYLNKYIPIAINLIADDARLTDIKLHKSLITSTTTNVVRKLLNAKDQNDFDILFCEHKQATVEPYKQGKYKSIFDEPRNNNHTNTISSLDSPVLIAQLAHDNTCHNESAAAPIEMQPTIIQQRPRSVSFTNLFSSQGVENGRSAKLTISLALKQFKIDIEHELNNYLTGFSLTHLHDGRVNELKRAINSAESIEKIKAIISKACAQVNMSSNHDLQAPSSPVIDEPEHYVFLNKTPGKLIISFGYKSMLEACNKIINRSLSNNTSASMDIKFKR